MPAHVSTHQRQGRTLRIAVPTRGHLPREIGIIGDDQDHSQIHGSQFLRLQALSSSFERWTSEKSWSIAGEPAETSNSGTAVALTLNPAAAAAALAFCGVDGFCFMLVERFRFKAESTTLRRSTSIRSGCSDEYSAWNMTFEDWQIIRKRTVGSSAPNCARRQSRLLTPNDSNSRKPSAIAFRSWCMSRKNTRLMRKLNRVKAIIAAGMK